MMKSTLTTVLALLFSLTTLTTSSPLPAPNPAPEPYVITQYIEVSDPYTVSEYTRRNTVVPASVVGYTRTVVPTATPTNALRTVTDSTSYAQVTVVEVLLEEGTVPTTTRSGGVYDDDYYDYYYGTSDVMSTEYVVAVTYVPAATCSSYSQTWILTTTVPIAIPRQVQPHITPLTVSASATTWTNYNNRLSASTQAIAILNPTDVPADAVASAMSLYQPYGMKQCYTPTTSCSTPIASATDGAICATIFKYDYGDESSNGLGGIGGGNTNGSGTGSGGSSRYRYDDVYGYPYRSAFLIVILVPVAWVLLFFIFGLLESWFSFKGLMLGKQRKRGTPYLWCCISCFSLCCVGPTYKAKSVEEQAILAERWKELKVGKKLGLWLKWGFRWKYPDVLGEAPEVDRRALRERCL